MHSNAYALRMPVLMLSTGFEPLFQTTWKRALTAVFGGRAEVVETHKTLTIGTSSGKLPYPTKVRFITGIVAGKIRGFRQHARLSRKNVFLRDKGKCQYCLDKLTLSTSTIDHITPKSRGGPNIWENVVLACNKCNQKKGPRLPREAKMTLHTKPARPGIGDLLYTRTP